MTSPSSNPTIATLLKHRTIRQFSDQSVSDETMQALFDVAIQTATSMGMQNTSIIWVKDKHKQKELARINGQDYVADAPVYLLFVADLHRPSRILREAGFNDDAVRRYKVFTAAFTDACLQVQNVVAAAESLGLGTTILGGVLNDPSSVIDLLDLPELTFPVLALMLGYPGQNPQMKPRMDKGLRVMTDSYHDQENWHESLAAYDAALQTYYDLRDDNRPHLPYTKQLTQIYAPGAMRSSILDTMKAQGFILSE